MRGLVELGLERLERSERKRCSVRQELTRIRAENDLLSRSNGEFQREARDLNTRLSSAEDSVCRAKEQKQSAVQKADMLHAALARRGEELEKARVECERQEHGSKKLQQELRTLQQQARQRQMELQEAQEAFREERARGRRPTTVEEAVALVAKLERDPVVRTKNPGERQQLKRKILAKWHPDKSTNPDLANKMMQELQNSEDWG